MSDEYPLKPTDADLDQESTDAQEPHAVMAWQSEEPVLVLKPEFAEPARDVRMDYDALVRLQEEVAALRFKAREWEDRARDMERERDDLIESRDLLLDYVKDKPGLRGVVRGFFLMDVDVDR